MLSDKSNNFFQINNYLHTDKNHLYYLDSKYLCISLEIGYKDRSFSSIFKYASVKNEPVFTTSTT